MGMMTGTVRYQWTLLRAGRLLLDGGSMFGVVPRAVWSRVIEADEKNRIELAHNCLLLEPVEPIATGDNGPRPPRKLIIETGTGDKLDEKMSSIFGLDGRTVESALIEAGHDPGDIEAVIVSHLHFDHAGGLTRRCRDNEQPDWTAAEGDSPLSVDRVKLTFPNAAVHLQQREWHDAIGNQAVMTRTYYVDHLGPLRLPLPDGRERLVLHDSPRPFPTGYRPGREQLPKVPLSYRETEIAPGVSVFLTPGHTWGQQAVKFTEGSGRTVVFVPDVMPSVHHVGAAYNLAYDVEAYMSMITRHWLLEEAALNDWLLVLGHEPGNPFQRVRRTDRGWYELTPVEP